MGLSSQAVKVIDRSILRILSHGCYADMADGLVLYAKSKVATYSAASMQSKLDVVSEAIKLLGKAAELARKIENYSKVKTIVYLQVFP